MMKKTGHGRDIAVFGCEGRGGDPNADDARNISDAVFVLPFLLTILVAAASLVGGCGDDARREKSDRSPSEASPARSELIPLTSRVTPRRDLPSDSRKSRSGSKLELPSGTTRAERATAGLTPPAEWASEKLNDFTTAQLKHLFAEPSSAVVKDVVAPGFRCAALRPTGLRVQFQSASLTVLRAPEPPGANATFTGPDGLLAALVALRAEFAREFDHFKIKTVGVDLPSDPTRSFATRVLVELCGTPPASEQRRQINASWTCTWARSTAAPTAPDASTSPRLLGIRVDRHEEVVRRDTRDGRRSSFADGTTAVLGAVPSFTAQQMRGIEYWAQRVTRPGDMHLTGHHGLAVGDVDGDGLDDLYVCDGGSLPNRLYLQNPDATLRDASSESGTDWLEDSRSALLVDLDGDGDQDLVVATIVVIVFAENDGAARFTVRGGHRGAPYPFSLTAADYDSDGDLDIYACVYAGAGGPSAARGFEARSPVPYYDANNGGRNVLLENFGAFRFADVTDEVGLDQGGPRWSFAAAWEDYDRDGDPDLYVANDFGRNNLYRNDARPDGSRRFVDVAGAAGVEDQAAGMSVAWADYNRDGRMDLYVGNMFSSAGGRISYQRSFATRQSDAGVASLQRMARGNTLFAAGTEPGRFTDNSEAAGVTMGRWAWSSGFVDVNNDGWEDIVITNGFMTNARAHDL